ncbi:MAG: S41 family peptidase [Rhodothermales bacterium]|nr:S41 family peptidase [Rhodothermales bacterium]
MCCQPFRPVLCVAAALLALAPAGGDLLAQPRRPGPPAQTATVSAVQKADLVAALQRRIAETYTFPDSAAALARHLDDRLAAGAYDGLTEAVRFADRLTEHLRAFTGDLHFAVVYDPARYARIESMGLGPNPAQYRFDGDGLEPMPVPEAGTPRYRQVVEPLRRRNFNFRKVEVLDGNVGYLRIETMPPLALGRAKADAAMAFLADVDALVLDLRDVPGGTGGFIPYLMSYFFPPGDVLLFTREFAFADTSVAFHTYPDLPGPRLDGVPLYVLTSGMTGSAAENLAYTLQQHGRATVVGEATAGGAHSSSMMLLADGFVAQIPIARVVHPVSGTNWQGVGVQPDLPAPAAAALHTAHAAALEHLLEATEDPPYREQLARYRTAVQADAAASEDTRRAQQAALAEYEGRYGTRRVFVQDGTLHYQRPGGPAVRLARIGDDLFRFDLEPGMQSPVPLPHLRFDRDASGAVVGMTALREDGAVQDVFERAR